MSENQSSAPIAENKMGTMPVGKLVFNMSLPMMISMLVQALYNIVDSIDVYKRQVFPTPPISLTTEYSGKVLALSLIHIFRMRSILNCSLKQLNTLFSLIQLLHLPYLMIG